MKFHFKEQPADYKNYIFPYQVYAEIENTDEIEQLYAQGFVKSRLGANTMYLCRSSRVNLQELELSSENRRILRKVEHIELRIHELKNFEYHFSIGKMAKDFYDTKFGVGTMSAQKMKWIFTEGEFTHILEYFDKKKGKVIGYCPIYMNEKIFHYAYPFYENNYYEKSLGMGMLTMALEYGKNQGLQFGYLGTVYSESSLYKTQFKGFEFFDGERWNKDIDSLKSRIT